MPQSQAPFGVNQWPIAGAKDMSVRQSQQRDLKPIQCVTCGMSFTPYRVIQIACSRACRDKQPSAKARSTEYRQRPDVIARKNEQRRANYAANDHRRLMERDRRLKKYYGIGVDDYALMFANQDGVCAICHNPATGGPKASAQLHVDHDHASGAVRGLLCTRCNQGIGYFDDNPALLAAAIGYLAKHSSSEERSA